jgi:hypothetical protein
MLDAAVDDLFAMTACVVRRLSRSLARATRLAPSIDDATVRTVEESGKRGGNWGKLFDELVRD